jgi:hypothetical protein
VILAAQAILSAAASAALVLANIMMQYLNAQDTNFTFKQNQNTVVIHAVTIPVVGWNSNQIM